MKAPDQLRQRVAWAFSQILVVSPGSIDSEDQSEGFLTYYDNFVRNAFGNYGVMLKETAYSPMMGEMLTFLQSKSTAYIWEQESTLEYADENFAREIMQLFSIGLYELNTDGTKVLVDGVPVRTYSNFDIGEYARAWTGFDRQNRRGNVEEPSWDENRIDPMQIRLEWRDHLPKVSAHCWLRCIVTCDAQLTYCGCLHLLFMTTDGREWTLHWRWLAFVFGPASSALSQGWCYLPTTGHATGAGAAR